MQARYSRDITILPSQIDAYGYLRPDEAFSLFMEIATEAAGRIGVGMDFLKKRGMFWITVKTKVRFIRRPGILDAVRVSTWPERPGEKRCNRHYEISRDGEPLVVGKTEWAIVSVLTGRPQNLRRLLPDDLEYGDAPACPEPFPMIDENFAEPPFAEHRVGALDIDMARHMNNVAYVRAIMNCFTVDEWRRMDVRGMDVIFLASAREGDVLRFFRRRTGNVVDIRGVLP